MRLVFVGILLFTGLLSIGTPVHAEEQAALDLSGPIYGLLSSRLSQSYPGAHIGFVGQVRWVRGEAPSRVTQVQVLRETGNGDVHFLARGASGDAEGIIGFSADMKAWAPIRRIMPGEALHAELFKLQDVNTAQGMAREYRGVFLPVNSDLETLEARQTLLEGQYTLSTGVQRIPDIKRGDMVRIQMRSGDLMLSTSGQAEEPGYLDGPIRVMIQKSKRTLSGTLVAKGTVEVKL